MNRKSIILTVILALVVSLTLAVASASATPEAAKSQSASGKVTAVAADSFTLALDASKTMEFVTNADTKVEGNLAEGATANVTYRVEDGKSIAIKVTIVS